MDVLVHFDEIFLKGKNQGLFVSKLADNIRRLFKNSCVKRVEGGFVLSGIGQENYKILALIPGIAKFAKVLTSKTSIQSLKNTLNLINISDRVESFRISTTRSDKKYKLTSSEINQLLGSYIEQRYKLQVDLKNFDLEIHVDILKNCAFVYEDLAQGVGGLPTGSSGKVLCLLSGGIDSPVAAYELMKRGAEISLVHFQNKTKVSGQLTEKIIDLAKTLAKYQPIVDLHIIDFNKIQQDIIMNIPLASRMVVSRRMMFRLAEELTKKIRCQALATGDSLGQVASQTLDNLTAIYEAVDLLTLTPLMGRNKSEIVKIAQKISTFDISNRPYPDCCSFLASKHPKIKSKIKDVLSLEKYLTKPSLDKCGLISYHISTKYNDYA